MTTKSTPNAIYLIAKAWSLDRNGLSATHYLSGPDATIEFVDGSRVAWSDVGETTEVSCGCSIEQHLRLPGPTLAERFVEHVRTGQAPDWWRIQVQAKASPVIHGNNRRDHAILTIFEIVTTVQRPADGSHAWALTRADGQTLIVQESDRQWIAGIQSHSDLTDWITIKYEEVAVALLQPILNQVVLDWLERFARM